jgi:hypothetical protein
MKIAQNIVKEIIRQMAAFDPNLSNGRGIAIKDVKGQVVSLEVSASGERDYLGLSDIEGTYYYFRLNGTTTEVAATPAQRYGSCSMQIQQRVPLKLVAQHRCQSPIDFLESLKSALYSTTPKMNGVDNILFLPANSNPVPWEVYAAETGREPETLQSLLQVVSLDFTLQIQYSPSNECFNNKIC